MFDCDAPENIQEIIQEIDSCPVDFKLLLSNRMFEVWLLMHFEDVEVPLTKAELMERLSRNLGSEYKKANQGMIREIFSNGDVNAAIENAERLVKKFDQLNKYVTSDINEMNPYTNLGKLIEQLVGKISL